MRANTATYVLCLILALSVFAGIGVVTARTNDIIVDGVGAAIKLSFPEEAHPNENINHTIMANTTVETPMEIRLFVYAPVDSTYQLIASNTSSWATLPAISLPAYNVSFTLPQNTNGTLRCVLRIQTNQVADYASYTFYTTTVRSKSYGELLSEYNGLLANYSKLVVDYESLLDEYDGLLSEHVALISSHEALLNEHTALEANYTSVLESQRTLQSQYNQLEASYEDLNTEFNNLTDAHNILSENYSDLEDQIADLEKQISDLKGNLNSDKVIMLIFIIAVVGLIALVVYVKRKKQEPYLVIRKETSVLGEEDKE